MIKYLKNFYLFVILIFSGYGILFTRQPEASFFLIAFAAFYQMLFKIKFNKVFINILLIWTTYAILTSISVKSFNPYLFIYNPSFFYAAFIGIKLLGSDIINQFEKQMYYLSIVSLFFFTWQIINRESLFSILNIFNVNHYTDYFSIERTRFNVIIYNVNDKSEWNFPRNCGFSWEPGPFGCFLVVAMFFNMIIHRFSFTKNKHFWIFLITLITTQSTTAFVTFFILSVWALLNNEQFKRVVFIGLPIAVFALFLLFTNVPVLWNKIVTEYSQVNDIDQMVDTSIKFQENYAPGRFASFLITWKDFQARPILGYGVREDLQWTRQQGAFILPVSAIGSLLAKYGLVGLFLWLFVLIKSSKFYDKNASVKLFKYAWILIVISISIGFSIVFSPIFMTFYFIPLYVNKVVSSKQKEYKYVF